MKQSDTMKLFRALDKHDRLGSRGVFDLLTAGRKDASGDFTEGVGLSPASAGCILDFLSSANGSKSNEETLMKMRRWFEIMTMPKSELDELQAALEAIGLITEEDKQIASDPVALREYYGTRDEKPVWR